MDSVKIVAARGGIGVACSSFGLVFCIHSRIHELGEGMITSAMLDLNGRAEEPVLESVNFEVARMAFYYIFSKIIAIQR